MPDPPVFINSDGLIFNPIFFPDSVPAEIILPANANHPKFISNFFNNSDAKRR